MNINIIRILLIGCTPMDRNLIQCSIENEGRCFEFDNISSFSDFGNSISSKNIDLVVVNHNNIEYSGARILNMVGTVTSKTPVVMITRKESGFKIVIKKSGTPYYFIGNSYFTNNLPHNIFFILENQKTFVKYRKEFSNLKQLSRL